MSPNRRLHRVAYLSFAAVAVGCAPAQGEGPGESGVAAAAVVQEQTGIDVQVLQVWTPGRVLPNARGWLTPGAGDVTIDAADPSVCTTLSERQFAGTQAYDDREVDCSAALAKAAPFDATGEPGPVMTPTRFVVTKRVSDGYVYLDPDYCNRVEMRVVVRDDAAARPTFAGVGFWSSHGDSFAPKADLQAVGHVRLARGDAATVYRFTGISTCISSAHDSTSGNMYQTFSFKPYAAYDEPTSGDVVRYRVWEAIPGNHAIGRSWPGASPQVDTMAFDRQSELLAH